MSKVQQNPDFEKIIKDCINELNIKFKDYGNSWQKCDVDYWFKRIENEFDEFTKSMTQASARRKLLNIINMCAMAIDNFDEGRMKWK